MSVNAPFFEIYCKPESIVMSEFTTSDCVTVEVTMVFLCPFWGEKKEAYNDEKRNTVNDLVAVVTYYGLAWLLLIEIFQII